MIVTADSKWVRKDGKGTARVIAVRQWNGSVTYFFDDMMAMAAIEDFLSEYRPEEKGGE